VPFDIGGDASRSFIKFEGIKVYLQKTSNKFQYVAAIKCISKILKKLILL
jgi:hypothetical protein